MTRARGTKSHPPHPRAAARGSPGPVALLRRLDSSKARFGEGAGEAKLALLRALDRARLPRAVDVSRLHEILCFLRAYPDDRGLLAEVESMIGSFSRRPDLRRHRERLEESGIAGTGIRFRFFAPTASWLARRWGPRLTIDWKRFRKEPLLERWLPSLTLYAETPALDEYAFTTRQWLARLKGTRETDAYFLIRRFDALRVDPFVREKLFDELDTPMRLAWGPGGPSRTAAKRARPPVVYQRKPLDRSRPVLAEELRRPPESVRAVPAREAQALIDLAREAMITRSRDLDVFSYADRRDVRLVDCGGGLEFVCIGATPERRLLLEAVYGFLTLKNGVPIGYVLASALFGSSEIAYNVFETYRGGEAAAVYGRVLAMVRHLFGSDAFTIFPYQLGHENDEALRSGAWWFYQKLGFRPRDPATLALMRRELDRMKTDPGHRSGRRTLGRLGSRNLFYFLGRPRRDVIGILSLADVGLRVSGNLAARFGSDREGASRASAREAARLLGVPSVRAFSPGERLAWERWSPLVMSLPGLERWTGGEKRALVAVVRAKGGVRESDFVRLFDRHVRLRSALRSLAETGPAGR